MWNSVSDVSGFQWSSTTYLILKDFQILDSRTTDVYYVDETRVCEPIYKPDIFNEFFSKHVLINIYTEMGSDA